MRKTERRDANSATALERVLQSCCCDTDYEVHLVQTEALRKKVESNLRSPSHILLDRTCDFAS